LMTPGLDIVPVLVNGAAMPRADELPASLHPLLRRHAAIIRRNPDFHGDVNRLATALKASARTGVLDLASLSRESKAAAGARTPTGLRRWAPADAAILVPWLRIWVAASLLSCAVGIVLVGAGKSFPASTANRYEEAVLWRSPVSQHEAGPGVLPEFWTSREAMCGWSINRYYNPDSFQSCISGETESLSDARKAHARHAREFWSGAFADFVPFLVLPIPLGLSLLLFWVGQTGIHAPFVLSDRESGTRVSRELPLYDCYRMSTVGEFFPVPHPPRMTRLHHVPAIADSGGRASLTSVRCQQP
jgi:hypothetical protein